MMYKVLTYVVNFLFIRVINSKSRLRYYIPVDILESTNIVVKLFSFNFCSVRTVYC